MELQNLIYKHEKRIDKANETGGESTHTHTHSNDLISYTNGLFCKNAVELNKFYRRRYSCCCSYCHHFVLCIVIVCQYFIFQKQYQLCLKLIMSYTNEFYIYIFMFLYSTVAWAIKTISCYFLAKMRKHHHSQYYIIFRWPYKILVTFPVVFFTLWILPCHRQLVSVFYFSCPTNSYQSSSLTFNCTVQLLCVCVSQNGKFLSSSISYSVICKPIKNPEYLTNQNYYYPNLSVVKSIYFLLCFRFRFGISVVLLLFIAALLMCCSSIFNDIQHSMTVLKWNS